VTAGVRVADRIRTVATEGVPRIRLAGIPREAVLVVRGDDPEGTILADARRFRRRFAAWGRYGVSAFVARDDAEVAALCESRLEAWARVLVFRRSALEESGLEIVPTFRTPHVTIAHADLGELVRRLLGCEHEVVENPYHEGEPGDGEA
jgi:hypothetical protein